MSSRCTRLALAAVLLASGLAVGLAASDAGASSPHQNTISMHGATYTPKASAGGTDDYHCTLVNPHVTQDCYIVKAQFHPNSVEVHHAILFLIPPKPGRPGPGRRQGRQGLDVLRRVGAARDRSRINQISNTPWLTAWAPGSRRRRRTSRDRRAGCLPAAWSSMQIHYNLLQGDKPVRATLQLTTVPSSTHLQRLELDLRPAPPDVPCPAGVTGPLCDRQASMADLAARFGPWAVTFDNIIEQACGRNPDRPAGGRHDLVHLAHRRAARPSSGWARTCTSPVARCASPSTPARRTEGAAERARTTTSTTRSPTRWPIR